MSLLWCAKRRTITATAPENAQLQEMFRLSRANSRTTHWKANMIWRRKIEEIESVESDLRYRKRECVNWYDPISYGANCLNHSILFYFLCSLLSTYSSTATVGCAGRVHGGCHNIILPLKLLIHFGHKLKHVRQQIGGFGFLCLNSAFSQSVHGTQTILCVMPQSLLFLSLFFFFLKHTRNFSYSLKLC